MGESQRLHGGRTRQRQDRSGYCMNAHSTFSSQTHHPRLKKRKWIWQTSRRQIQTDAQRQTQLPTLHTNLQDRKVESLHPSPAPCFRAQMLCLPVIPARPCCRQPVNPLPRRILPADISAPMITCPDEYTPDRHVHSLRMPLSTTHSSPP